jgi:hypothetical protein
MNNMKSDKNREGRRFLHKWLCVSIFMILLIITIGYFEEYYQTNTTHQITAAILEKLDVSKKIFIVHTPAGPFSLKNVKLVSENLAGDKTVLNPKYEFYLYPAGETGIEFPRKQKIICLNQVHLYTDTSFEGNNPVRLAINRINRMDVYGLDQTSSKKDKIVGAIAIGLIGITGIISLLLGEKTGNLARS